MHKTDCAVRWIPDKIWERVPGHRASNWECPPAVSVEQEKQYGSRWWLLKRRCRQEEHPVCKNWVMRCWCGYLSEAMCRLFADATVFQNPIMSCHRLTALCPGLCGWAGTRLTPTHTHPNHQTSSINFLHLHHTHTHTHTHIPINGPSSWTT